MSAIGRSMGLAGLVALCLVLVSGVSGRAQTVDFTFVGKSYG